MTQLLMTAPLGASLKKAEVCALYTLRTYRAGDEKAWESIVETVFNAHVSFDELKADPAYRPERVFFAVDRTGRAAATATCWEVPSFYPKGMAVLHMVGVLPRDRGHALGTAVSSAAMERATVEGFSMMALRTDDFRLPAVATYLRLGFLPRPLDETQIERWLCILKQLNRKDVAAKLPQLIWNGKET